MGGPTMDDKAIQALATQWQASRALLAAFELDLFTALGDQALTGAEVAAKAKTDPRATDRLLRAMVPLGLVTVDHDRFSNTDPARCWLDRASPDCLTGLGHTAHTYKNWSSLHQAVRKGTAAISTEFESEHRRAAFIESMHRRSKDLGGRLAGLVGLSGTRRLLDVGGGSGGNSIVFCRAEPGLTAVIVDKPTITPLTRGYVEEAGLSDRIRVVEADYHQADFAVLSEEGFDLVLLSAIVHINSPDQNQSLMDRVAKALAPGGRVAVNEFLMSEDRLEPAQGTLFALNMLVNTDCGDAYTYGEIRSWLEAAGLDAAEPVISGPTTSLILARKP